MRQRVVRAQGSRCGAAAAALAAAALATGCAADSLAGTEPWSAAPEIRIALIAREDGVTVRALDATTPVQASLTAGEDAELWLFAYRADTLRAVFPGLTGRSPAEIVALLAPVVVPGTGLEAPPADEVLSAELASAGSIAYQRRAWTDWTSRSTQGLRFTLDLPDEAVCGSFGVEPFAVPVDVHLDGLALAGPDRAYLTGTTGTATTGPLHAFVLEGAGESRTLRDLGARSERGPSYGHPSWDPKTATVWDIDADGDLYRFDATGAAQPVPAPPDEPDVVPQAQWVSVGTDGTLMATYLHPSDVGHGEMEISPALFRYGDGAWTFALIRDGSFGFVDVVNAERVLTYYHCWVYHFRDPSEENGWKQGLIDDACRSLRDADLDEDGGIVAGLNGWAKLRDDVTHGWIDATPGLPREAFVAAAAMGQGRAIVGSTEGSVFVRRGARWCPVEHGVPGGQIERAEAVDGVAYLLVGTAGSRAQQVVRVEIR